MNNSSMFISFNIDLYWVAAAVAVAVVVVVVLWGRDGLDVFNKGLVKLCLFTIVVVLLSQSSFITVTAADATPATDVFVVVVDFNSIIGLTGDNFVLLLLSWNEEEE